MGRRQYTESDNVAHFRVRQCSRHQLPTNESEDQRDAALCTSPFDVRESLTVALRRGDATGKPLAQSAFGKQAMGQTSLRQMRAE
jgi:hypothetical protein